ncbi:MAG: conjugal transfer protein TraX [Oscillospiraceae bacterium]|nr:conjugal transfer protein TraX [Oscillospiraceae bacterium]
MSTFNLKLLAITAMFVDHAGVMLIPEGTPLYFLFRIIGRVAFPIFAFLIVEGYFHTRNISKYMTRLALFAVISEIPYNLLMSGNILYPEGQNVFFTLLAGLAAIGVYQKFKDKSLYAVLITLALLFAVEFAHTDYASFGVVTTLLFYTFRKNRLRAAIIVGALNILYGLLGVITSPAAIIQAFAAVSILPIYLYNGEKGPSLKYFFYAFYPAHILALYIIAFLNHA